MQIRILGAHNTESSQCRLSGILIGKELVLDAGSLTSSLSFEEQLGLKAVLLTHRHYDHIRDVPALGMTLYLNSHSVGIYALPEVLDTLTGSLINGQVYPDFTRRPEEKPAFSLVPITPGERFELAGYHITPVPVPHSVPAAGFLVWEPGGKALFYTGDTGPGFAAGISGFLPDMLVVEVTASNRFTSFGQTSKHLTPALLEGELAVYSGLAGQLPHVICVHMHKPLEEEIKQELADVAARLGTQITPGSEDMLLTL